MITFIKKECTLTTAVATNADKWHCGCVKCVAELKQAGWQTSSTDKCAHTIEKR